MYQWKLCLGFKSLYVWKPNVTFRAIKRMRGMDKTRQAMEKQIEKYIYKL